MKPYYEHGGITIYHGDCREILPQISEVVDCLLTDPPYNCGMEYENDEDYKTHAAYEVWCSEWFALTERIVTRKRLIFPGHGNVDMWFRIARPHGIGCWYKPGSPRHGGIFQFCEWEPFLVYDPTCRPIGGSDVFKCSLFNQSDTGDHPCPKPLPLFADILRRSHAESVIDCFAGSGTTLIAAKKQNRRAIGIEIEEKYCEIAAKRLSQEVFKF